MADLCVENGLPFRRLGKVIVPVRENQDTQIDLLARRAAVNGATVEVLNAKQLAELEPEVRTATGRALYSPATAVVDPKALVKFLVNWLSERGVAFYWDTTATDFYPDEYRLDTGRVSFCYKRLYNATGQFADLIARRCGLSDRYTILPFKGIYYRLAPTSGIRINRLLYPVPDLNMPFLGIHSVKSVDGTDYFGPTAVPAFGRENYRGVQGVQFNDALNVAYWLADQYVRDNQGFRGYLHAEAGRFLRSSFAAAARDLVPRLRAEDLLPSDKVGIRAQLLDRREHRLVMDFVVERVDNTTHVLNAVSPAFTSALSFADTVIDAERLPSIPDNTTE